MTRLWLGLAGVLSVGFTACTDRFISCEKLLICGGTGQVTGEGGASPEKQPTLLAAEQLGCTGICEGATPYCDELKQECVACRKDAHCAQGNSKQRPVCQEGSCSPCATDEQCRALSDGALTRCLPSGACVECVEGEDCGGKLCDAQSQRCTDLKPHTADACEPCVMDEQCQPGQHCVEMRHGDSTSEQVLGRFCLWDRLELPGETCREKRPFARAVENSVNTRGELVQVCAPRTTCAAVASYGDYCEEDEDCGRAGLDDAKCVLFAGEKSCTFYCTNTNECFEDSTCPAPSGGARLCSL